MPSSNSNSNCNCRGYVSQYDHCGHNTYSRRECSSTGSHASNPPYMHVSRYSTACPAARCWGDYYATGGASNRQEGM